MDVAAEPTIRVLLVEDDVKLARLVTEYLEARAMRITHVADGRLAVREAVGGGHDVVLLDVSLPGLDGLEVCRAVRRESSVPILFLTARADETDRVVGLELGGDDYVVKPFSSRELAARVRALHRRSQSLAGVPGRVLRTGSLELDPERRAARRHGRTLDLSSREFDLLRALMERRGRVLGRTSLVELLHGSAEEAFDRSIDVAVHRLRQKLEDHDASLLKTVRGVGYLLAPEDE